MPIKKLGQTITQELAQVFERINESQIEKFIDAVINAERIILIGVGREGPATRAFTMLLMHIGLDAHWSWDDTAPIYIL